MLTGTKTSHNRTDRIHLRRGILGCGAGFTMALDDKGCVRYTGENRWGQSAATAWQDVLAVYCGQDYILGLCKDGTVLGEGRNHFHQLEVESWACVSSLSCGQKHAAALIGNGRVLCSGDNRFGQCDTILWRDMVDIACGRNFTVGLHKDGSVWLAGGDRMMAHILENFKDVAGIFTDYEGKTVYGITGTEGKLLSSGMLPMAVRQWRHLVYVAASARGIVGVTSHGRILCTNPSDEKFFHRQVGEFVACAAGQNHVSALCKNGEILSTGHNEFGQTGTSRWGRLYSGFEAFSTMRREAFLKKERTERAYQKSLSEAVRHGRRLSCGERLTACIQADGHVSATAGLRQVKKWMDVCSLSCGSAHILALHKDGHVSADGNNVGGCCRVDGWKTGKAVLAGKYHSLCLCEDGSVLFAGWNVHEQGNVSEWKHIRILRGTDTYTVGVDVEGHIYTSGKKLPFDPDALSGEEWQNLVDVAVSEHHIVGLKADGRVVALGDDTCRISPAKNQSGVLDVSAWRGVRAIAVGEGFTVGLCYGGRVVAAGRNDMGQCDTSTWQHAVYVGCGRTYTAALLSDGRVVTTGQHRSGMGGKESPSVSGGAVMAWEKAESTGYEPFHTAYMTDILALHTGPEHLVAVDRHGQIMAEGLDLDGQCTSASAFLLFRDIRQLDGFGIFNGTGSSVLPTTRPNTAQTDKPRHVVDTPLAESATESIAEGHQVLTVKEIFSPHTPWHEMSRRYLTLAGQGLAHTVILGEDGRVNAWGAHTNAYSDVVSWGDACMVTSGTHHTVAVLQNGQVVATGRDTEGQCGVASWQDMSDGCGFKQIACCYHTTTAVTQSGQVLLCGSGYGGDVLQLQNIQMVACGLSHMAALTADGQVICQGDNTHGQCDTTGWADMVMVAVGDNHTVGLTKDRQVVAVGDNTHGQCDVSGLVDVVYVACLPEATLCVSSSGKVIVRGGTEDLETRVAALQGVTALYAHEYRLSAILSDGRWIQVI